ncbi:hypothetical protein [Acinetobacter ursingii]|uniref:hypothetical protein n=1 Tax=Acinetobacter ursingii TaxID=108980 RepID=UPI00124FDBC2|nr:hypothetical protein [Acinetobacter ursingii]
MNIFFNDLLELEQEFMDCLFSYYQHISLENDTHQDWAESSEDNKRIMIADLKSTQLIVLKERMRTNDLALNETYQFHQELFGNGILNLPVLMCAELAGDFHLGDSRQLTDKSLLPFDLVS